MNPEGLLVEKMQQTKDFNIKFDENVHIQFKERLDFMVNTYCSSPQYTGLIPTLNEPIPEDKTINQSSWWIEFQAILIRAFKNEARNPMEVKAKVMVTFVFVAVILIVFSGVNDNYFKKIFIKCYHSWEILDREFKIEQEFYFS